MILEEEREPLLWRWELLLPLFFCAAVNVILVITEAKLPFADVFLFKEAGYRFATEGRFVARNLPHLPPDLDFVYAYYVPIYSFCYGLWAIAFGTSLKASIAFDQTIKMARAMLAFWLVWPGLRTRYLTSGLFRVLVLVLFAILGMLPGYTDRPDYLAACFGVISLILLSKRGSSASAFAGIALGLSAATSPCAGLFFLTISWLFVRDIPNRLGLLLAAVFTFSSVVFPILILDPDALYRFLQQARMSTLPLIGLPFMTIMKEIYQTFWLSGKLLTIPALYVCAVTFLIVKKSNYRGTWFKLLLRCSLFFPIASFIWTYQFRYFVFPLFISIVSLAVILANLWEEKWAKYCFATILLVLMPHMILEANNLMLALARPDSLQSEVIRENVLQKIEPKARLAISSEQYFTFRPFREVSLAYYVCGSLEKYSAIFLSGSDIATPDLRPPCHEKRELFEVDQDMRTTYSATPFGAPAVGGGVLFRRVKEQKNDAIAYQQ